MSYDNRKSRKYTYPIDSIFGLKIGSVYRTIGKFIRSDLPILKLCDGLTSVTGGRKYMYVGFTIVCLTRV